MLSGFDREMAYEAKREREREYEEELHEEKERAALAEAVLEYQDTFEETPGCVDACFADGATAHASACSEAYLVALASAGDADARRVFELREIFKAYGKEIAARAAAPALAAPVADAVNGWLASQTVRRAA